ncbi:MAG: hypothetical protein AAF745_15310 [Planctomycetota bacterium]
MASAQDETKSSETAKDDDAATQMVLSLSDVAIFRSSSSDANKVVISMAGQASPSGPAPLKNQIVTYQKLAGKTPGIASSNVTMRQEVRTRLVPVQRTRAETRTRTVQEDGKEVTKNYTVQVPYTEMVTQTYTVAIPIAVGNNPVGSKGSPSSTLSLPSRVKTKSRFVKFERMAAWDLSGKPIPTDELASRLKKPLTAFLIDQPFGPDVKINPAHRAVLRSDAMLIQLVDD